MIDKLMKISLLLALCFTFGKAGESIFGINDYSIGMLNPFYSASGLGRSYEIANGDSLRLNFINFASWGQIANPTYGVSLGYVSAFSKDEKRNYFNDYMNFQGGYLGVPIIKKRLVFGLGLQPLSNIEQRFMISENGVQKHLLIRGGLSKGTVHLSYTFGKWLAMSLGYEYNFGRIDRSYRLELNESEYPLSFKYQYWFYGHGMEVSAYSRPLKNAMIGFIFRPAVNLHARIKPQTDSDLLNKSKLVKLNIPAFWGFGWRYDWNARTSVGADFIYQNWQDEFKVANQTLKNLFKPYYRLGIGFEHRQSHKLFTSFWQKLDYRWGFYYGQQYVVSNWHNINEYGVSLGFSVPITRFKSRADFTFLVGQRGDLKINQYKETFFKLKFTINASEIWFVKFED